MISKSKEEGMKMAVNYVLNISTSFNPDPIEPMMDSIFQQYERVLIESLITSFGLDFLLKDQYGGDVDTIHNVRQFGSDEQMTYKNVLNQKAYENRGPYNSQEYHSDPRYIAKNRESSSKKKAGMLTDAYTDERIALNGKSDLDHVISAKEIHDDRGRTLAGLRGTDLANCEENLQATNPRTNRTKKADSMEEFLEKYGEEYTEKQRTNMRKKDDIARKSYKAKLAKKYYTSPEFAKDLAFSAGNASIRMGARQALGLVFAEMWFSVKAQFQKVEAKDSFNLGDFLMALGKGIKQGYEHSKEKYAELFSRFFSGAIAGALSSLTTTLCNIFFTTAKNVVRIIRQSYASLVEAAKVLFINPENYAFGERMQAVAKIIAIGASVVVGVIVGEAIEKTPLGTIPVLGDAVQAFCGAFVTGVMSCTLLYVLDRNEFINKSIKTLDSLHTIETEISYYRQQADLFERYAAQLMQIDLDAFRNETNLYSGISKSIENADSEDKLKIVLINAAKSIGMIIPWRDYESFDSFVNDKNASMVFE